MSFSVKPVIDKEELGVESERCNEVFLSIIFIAVGLQQCRLWEEVQDFLLILL